MSVCAVVGGQFGSEGKGAVVAHIAREYDVHVRVGAANAGHTFYTETGELPDDRHSVMEGNPVAWEKHVMQQLPCAAYANPDATLMIGPGALVSPEIFDHEMGLLARWRRDRGLHPFPRIVMDRRAHVITEHQIQMEAASGLDERIGSTSATAREGIGWAQADRVMRSKHCVTAADVYDDDLPIDSGFVLSDVPRLLSFKATRDSILLEGTQGSGLSLTTGPFPYVTSRNTTVAGLCADVGIAPQRVDRTILVIRTFPIRVAGNSGPFWSPETSWETIGVDPGTERTTVTKKIRRVATFSMGQIEEAVRLNEPTEIALMFCDYLDSSLEGTTRLSQLEQSTAVYGLIRDIEEATRTPVRYLGTGPHSIIDLKESV